MNVAKFAVRAIKEWNPLSPEGYARRDRNKAYRKARRKRKRGEVLTQQEEQIVAGQISKVELPSGEKIEREEPIIPWRTSTKAGGTASIGTIVLGMVGVFFPDAMNSLTPEQALWIGGAITTLVAWGTARLTKSPSKPKSVL